MFKYRSFREFLQETELNEMQFDRVTALNKVKARKDELILHMIKIMRYGKTSDQHKHITDMQTGVLQTLNNIEVRLKKVRRLKESEYRDNLIFSNTEYQNYLDIIDGEYRRSDYVVLDFTEEEIQRSIDKALNDVIVSLGKGDFWTPKRNSGDVNNLFKKIVQKHYLGSRI